MSITTRNATLADRRRDFVRSGLLILTTVFTRSITAAIAETATNQDLLGSENWPLTVEDTVRDLLPRISLSERLKIKLTKKENIIALYIDLGTQIRSRYGLWRGNDKLILSACGHRCHPDDASMKIIEALWRCKNIATTGIHRANAALDAQTSDREA
jgi:hypothetical protein